MESLSLENLELRYNDLLLALVGCTSGRQAGVATGLNCMHLIKGSKSWQIMIYSHAGLVIRSSWTVVILH